MVFGNSQIQISHRILDIKYYCTKLSHQGIVKCCAEFVNELISYYQNLQIQFNMQVIWDVLFFAILLLFTICFFNKNLKFI